MKRRVFEYTLRLSLPADTDPTKAAEPIPSIINGSDDERLGGVGVHSVVVADAQVWLSKALGQGFDLWDDCADALKAYYEVEGKLPFDLGALCGYGEEDFDPTRSVHELYNIDEELLANDGFLHAAAIVDSELFGDIATLDRKYQDDDPRKSLTNLAGDLYQRTVMETAGEFLGVLRNIIDCHPTDPHTDQLESALAETRQIMNNRYENAD